MTKKHFEAIAADLKLEMTLATSSEQRATVSLVADRLSRTFDTQFPNFDRRRFLTACGV